MKILPLLNEKLHESKNWIVCNEKRVENNKKYIK